MPFRDKYTNFWFNDISSETMKVWLTNSKDIEFKATPNFTHTFVNPVSSQIRYHTGTTFSSNDFQLKCIAIGVNMLEWRAIENWLSPLAKGKLQFEFNDNTYYDVKVSKQVKGTSFVSGSNHILNNDTYNIEFTVEFTTTSDWAALGPQVVVPINLTYDEKSKVTLTLIDSPISTVSTASFTYTYVDMVADISKLDDAEWWRTGLDTTATTTSAIVTKLTGGTADKTAMVTCLKTSLLSHEVLTPSAAVNNKYGMPLIHNRTQSMNKIFPSKGAVTIPTKDRAQRKYITEPTLLVNKTIYLDETFYANMAKSTDDGGGGVLYKNYTYYLLDGSVLPKEDLTNDFNYSKVEPGLVGIIREKTIQIGNNATSTSMVVTAPTGYDTYGIIADSVITQTGTTFYGVSVLFTASSTDAFNYCPFYYLEEDNTYALMNASSYDAYPDLYLNLGLTVSTSVKKEQELLYQYNVAAQNVTLGVDGRTGFVTFNNLIAESATLTGDAGKTKVVDSSINNGTFSISSGNPELLKVRVFGITQPQIKPSATGTAEDVNVTQIFFQPVGEFKYARNGKFAAMLFNSIQKETIYNSGFYPLTSNSLVNAENYGSKIVDYLFTTNGLLSFNPVTAKTGMWVLTIPTKDFVGCSLCTAAKNSTTNALNDPQYMYLSLCNYTEVSITTDTSMPSYLMMQTRDAY
jgi:hypothetical protein